MKNDFLPGCYRNFLQEPDESFPGYLLRLAEANGYAGITDLLRATLSTRRASVDRMLHDLRTSRSDLSTLSRVAVGDAEHLLRHLAFPLQDGALVVNQMRVDGDAWLTAKAQVCPQCLSERGYLLEAWDWTVVTVCPEHCITLIDKCPNCAAPITWGRPHPFHCEQCGADLCTARGTETSLAEAEVAADYDSLAPFRMQLHDGELLVESWDSAFRIFKGLALTRRQWATLDCPSHHLKTLSLADRHKSTTLLAQVRVRGVYQLPRLVAHVHGVLEPLTTIPRPGLISKHAMQLWHAELGIQRPTSDALSSEAPIQPEPRGYEVFQGRPPRIYTKSGVENFLGVGTTTVTGLIKSGHITMPSCDEAFDIDDLVGSQRFLQDGLLTLSELALVFGVPLFGADAVRENFLPTWNPHNKADKRIEVEVVKQYHLSLLARYRASAEPSEPVTLGQLAGQTMHPVDTVIRSVMLILNGTIDEFGWRKPYRWADLTVGRRHVMHVLAGAELS